MTVKEKRKKLKRAQAICLKIEEVEEVIDNIENNGGVSSIRYDKERVTNSPTRNNLVEVLESKRKELKFLQEEFESAQQYVKYFIEDMGLPEKQEQVLILRYVDCLTWDSVSDLMGWDRETKFLHNGGR